MLGVVPLGRARAGYYLDDLGDELARLGATGPGACWTGRAAHDLGLHGAVSREGFQSLLHGQHPRTGRALLRRAVAVGGFDLTFSAPKAVSVLFALGTGDTPAHVVSAQRAAAGAVVGYLESRVLSMRRHMDGERSVVPTDGMLGASFLHCLSRAGDPHLHTHLVVANLAHGVDGRWSALDGRALYAHRAAAGALYEAHLRAELTARLGLTWRPGGRGWEPEGFDRSLAASFSGRNAEIRQAAAAAGARTPHGRRIAWAATRGQKDRRSGMALRREWARRADGLEPRPTVGSLTPPPLLDEHRFAAALAPLPGGVTRRDVVAAWAGAAAAGGEAPDLDVAVEHWAPAGAAVGVGEPRLAPARCLPAPHLVDALGARPVGAAGQPVWLAAARAIERYRTRWGTSERVSFLDEDRRAMAPRRLADHIELSRTVRDALARMGPERRPCAREAPALTRD